MTCGLGRAEIDEMTLVEDIADLYLAWDEFPPPPVALARLDALLCSWLGVAPRETRPALSPVGARPLTEEEAQAMAMQLNGA